jgi:hypothetical protein
MYLHGLTIQELFMKPSMKPLAAILVICSTTSALAAWPPAVPENKLQVLTCGPGLDSESGQIMNTNSPARTVAGCWNKRIAYGGATTLAFQRADSMSNSTTSETFLSLRTLSLFTDVTLNQDMALHLMLNQNATLTNNMPTGDAELGDNFNIDEAYLAMRNVARPGMYIKAGKSFTPFGNYQDPYPTVYSLNQSYVQAGNTNLMLGFASTAGFNVSAFVFENETSQDWNEYGVRIGFERGKSTQGISWLFNASYVDNYAALNGTMGSNPITNADQDQAAYDIQAGLGLGHAKLDVEYFRAGGNVLSTGSATTAEPKVMSINLAYDFVANNRDIEAHILFEKASDASAMQSLAFSAANQAEKHLNVGMTVMVDPHVEVKMDYHNFTPFDSSLDNQTQIVTQLRLAF